MTIEEGELDRLLNDVESDLVEFKESLSGRRTHEDTGGDLCLCERSARPPPAQRRDCGRQGRWNGHGSPYNG